MSNNNNINNNNSNCSLTQAGLEEYSRSYYEQNSIMYHHQKQSSYAQSEGYHSYVSSSDSSSTPFLDRLRQDSELLLSRSTHNWSQQDLQLTSSNNSISDNNSSESTSSTETLKWLGSMSDVSVASHATNTSGLSGSGSSQLIAHSSRVRTPQRHNSESILYLNDEQTSPLGSSASTTITTSSLSISGEDLRNKSQQNNNLRSSRSNNRLFPISTYTEIPTNNISNSSSTNTSPLIDQNNTKQLNSHNWQSVAERINELEKQQSGNNNNHNNVINNISSSAKNLSHMSKSQIIKEKYTYFDPSKTHRISNPTLKAFQKNAVQSYFERQQSYARESNHNLSRPTTLNLTSNGSQRSSISSYTSSMNGSMNNIELISPSQTYHHHPHHHHHTPSPQQQQQLDKISANNLRNQLHHHQSQQHIISNATIILQNDDNQSLSMSNDMCGPPPPPPPRTRSLTSATATVRRTSSASEYSSIRDQLIQQRQQLSKDLLGPMIMGPIISVDDWVPERPPKNPMLRIPSPELPPPPPPPSISTETDVILLNQDEPLPPPPPEILRHMRQSSDSGEPKSNVTSRRDSFAGQSSKKPLYRASTFENLSPPPPPSPAQIQTSSIIIPPAVPKKPITMDSLIQRRSSSVMGKPQTVQAHRILLNGKMDIKPQYQHFPVRLTDSRLSLRKRSHNSQSPGEFIIMKNNQQILSPPPLKPRMPVIVDTNGLISMGSKSGTPNLPEEAWKKNY